jgi:hypothetical protein
VGWAKDEAPDAIMRAEGVADYPRPDSRRLEVAAMIADRLGRGGVEVTPEAVSSGWVTRSLTLLDGKVALAWLKAERRIG